MRRGPRWRIEGRVRGASGPYRVLVRLRKEPTPEQVAFWRARGYDVVVVREK